MLKRSPDTGLLFERCSNCSNVLQYPRTNCPCKAVVCISCDVEQATKHNLCEECEKLYQCRFNEMRYLSRYASNVEHWIRHQFNTLYGRHGFSGGDLAFPEFRAWGFRAQRAYRLYFQERPRRFAIHRSKDSGRYANGTIYLIPTSENNVIRRYCRIEDFERVVDLYARRQVLGYTLEDIEHITGRTKSMICRWGKRGLKVLMPDKRAFSEYARFL